MTLDANNNAELETDDFLRLRFGGQSFCVHTSHVREIRQWSSTTYLPGAEHYVLGCMNLRGSILSVVDLAGLIGLQSETPTPRNPIVILESMGHLIRCLVSAAPGIIQVTEDDVGNSTVINRQHGIRITSGVIVQAETVTQILDVDLISALVRADYARRGQNRLEVIG